MEAQKEVQFQWYALKIFYNKVFEAEYLLGPYCEEVYIPARKVRLKGEEYSRALRRLSTPDDGRIDTMYVHEGPYLCRRQPVVTSLMFIRIAEASLPLIHKAIEGMGFIYKDSEWKRFAVIPDKQMSMFRMVVSSGDEGLEFFADDEMTRYRQGAKVRVKEGILQGAEGYIKRIRKDRRLLVAIDGFIAVATSYIPPHMLEIIEEAPEKPGTPDNA